MLRVGPLTRIPSMLTTHGHVPVAILNEVGVTEQLLAVPENTVSASAACRLLAVCSQKIDCPHFGVLLGKQSELSDLGMLGVLLRSSSNIQEALTYLVRYQRFQTQKSSLFMHLGAGGVYLFYREPVGVVGSGLLADAVLAGLCAIMHSLGGRDCVPSTVSFVHAKPWDTSHYQQHFNCMPTFSDNDNVISYSSRHLVRQLNNLEPRLKSIIIKQVENELFPLEENFVSSVYGYIEASIRSGNANATDIASLMGISVRTMSRHLEQHGLNFQSMLDDVKCKIATGLLDDTQMSITRIADFLRYNDTASFSRAFRRWHGMTPAEWRIRMGKLRKAN